MEGRSLHPHLTERGVRLFAEDEVAAVAVEVQRSGRALDNDRKDFPAREHEGSSWNAYETLQGVLAHSQQMVSTLETQLNELQGQFDEEQLESLSWSHRKVTWKIEMKDGIVLLARQIESPDQASMMIVEALDRLFGESYQATSSIFRR